MNIRALAVLVGAALVVLPGSAVAQDEEPPGLEARYQTIIDTLVVRLALPDSVAVRFREVIGTYLRNSEKIFADHQGASGREEMEAMSKALAEARARLDKDLEGILTQEQILRAREVMEELRQAQSPEDGGQG